MQKKSSGGDGNKDQNDSAYRIGDPQALARNMVRLFEEGTKVIGGLADKGGAKAGPYSGIGEVGEAVKIMGEVAKKWAEDPSRFMQAQTGLVKDYMDLWGRSMRRFLGKEEVDPVAEPQAGDARFKDPDWKGKPYFDFWKQAYLLSASWLEKMVDETEGLDDRTRQKARFYVEQLASALSPSNFPLTNPEVMRETLASNGENLVKGLSMLADDIKQSKDILKIRQTDLAAFEIGKNLAVTPGKVIFQNDIIQLIQYAPTTETVHKRPLLIVPPWINKFYILDLVPQKSFIKWVVDQGFTVFVVSWVNPDERLAAKTFEDYMREGILAAVEAAGKAAGKRRVNALGYCVGGTLLASTLAYMAATGDDRIKSATFLAAQVDFSKAGDLLVFIDDAQLKALEEMMSERGYLDGSRMATVFNMLRPRDLIWPYVVNNYMLGKQPFPFDLLYWNSDSTRMPAANHSFYLREFYHNNRLAKGELTLGDKKLDLKKVDIPIYELATREDHIAPAESVFIGSKLFGGPVRFVLAGSGHIAGVVNPPEKTKYQHWINDKTANTLASWIEAAEEKAGSWWPDWSGWLAERSGSRIAASERVPGSGPLKAIEDAPGSYVRQRTA
ncbi:MAG: class I poly(R)-hydroxyalkanoic acid synthase [Pseudomonadota bacterium]|nr:class I poly(R)-hydroxyalkanoic acid synthase [Pseudomonadota bacterium]